jgi:WD40 repeat protein
MVSPNAVFSVTFSPHVGRVLASGGADGTLRLWNVATRQEIGQPLSGHTSLVRSVAFSPDGRLVASGSSDQTVRLWDVATASQLGAALTGSHGGVETVAFSPDGTLATSGVDGTVRFWGGVAAPAYGRLRQRVCRFLGGGLSPTEWSLYAGNVPYQPTCSGVVPSAG